MPIDSLIPIVFNPSTCLCVCVWDAHTLDIFNTWQVLSERSLREVLFLCLGPRKSKILLQFVLKKSEAKQNNFIDGVSQEMGDSSDDTSTFGMC